MGVTGAVWESLACEIYLCPDLSEPPFSQLLGRCNGSTGRIDDAMKEKAAFVWVTHLVVVTDNSWLSPLAGNTIVF